MLGAFVLALPASADDLVEYDIDPATGPDAIASGTFTFDQTTDSITSWDIQVVDGTHTITFTDTGKQSAGYTFVDSVYDAGFEMGNGTDTVLELLFKSPGLGSITAGPATVPLLAASSVLLDGVKASIDNPSVSAVSEPGTLALMLAGLGLVGGLTMRRRVLDLTTAATAAV